jgi:hypothetical protein
LVRVGKLVYVVGASEGGLTRLGEIDASAVPPPSEGLPASRFSDILAKMARRGDPHAPPPDRDPPGHA